MKVVALRRRPAGGGVKPPRAALAEDRRGERRGKGARDASGGDREASESEPLLKDHARGLPSAERQDARFSARSTEPSDALVPIPPRLACPGQALYIGGH